MRQLLPDLTENWPTDIVHQYKGQPYKIKEPVLDSKNKNEIIHNYFWHKLPDFIPENSIVVAETGTSAFGKCVSITLLLIQVFILGIFNMRAPKGVTFISQILWGSIGYTVGAALGAALAGKDENRRVFLLVGDGSFQV
jgi:pyruvate decarboxylase